MNRFFIYRRRETGRGMYVSRDEAITQWKYFDSPSEFNVANVSGYDWRGNRDDAEALLNFDSYVEIPAEAIPLLQCPEHNAPDTPYPDRLHIPALQPFIKRPKIKGSNVKHKIGVPKNKLP